MNNNIFISISGCNEHNLNQTIKSAVANAADPTRLYFGVFVHNLKNELHDFEGIKANIVSAQCYYPAPLGVGIPRTFGSLLHDHSHRYYLQIDAHMIFEQNWDVDVIDAFERIRQDYKKPIISTYVPWWYEDEEGNALTYNNRPIDPYNFSPKFTNNNKMVFDDITQKNLTRNHVAVNGQGVDWSDGKPYVQHYATSGHFVFSTMDFFMEVLSDPLIVWGGEEPILALRAWTRGYRIFTIPKPIVWHKNKWNVTGDNNNAKSLKHTPLDKRDWRIYENIPDKKLYDLYTTNINKSYARIKDIFLGYYVGHWGSPSLELLKEFEDVAGVRFKDYYDAHYTYLKESDNEDLLRIMYNE